MYKEEKQYFTLLRHDTCVRWLLNAATVASPAGHTCYRMCFREVVAFLRLRGVCDDVTLIYPKTVRMLRNVP
jgi:hypothetical protein